VSTKPFIAARVEEAYDRWVERAVRMMGWRERVICYTGYGTASRMRVLGRVVLGPRRSTSPLAKATEEFVKRRGFRNFITVPCVRAPFSISVDGRRVDGVSDRGGYIDMWVSGHNLEPGWHRVEVQSAGSKRVAADIHVVADDQQFGIISDIDDTVISTWLPRPLIAGWNSFIRDESARQAVPGMAVLYHTLIDQFADAPIFYVSTGAWNTHGFLSRFLRRHNYPLGAMLLTDWGPTNTGWFRSGAEHKQDTMFALAKEFPGISWLLVGDDGQHDLELYSRFAARVPDRVRAIAIRQLSPTEQVLAHGTPVSMDAPDVLPCHVPVLRAPDGRGLLAAWRQHEEAKGPNGKDTGR